MRLIFAWGCVGACAPKYCLSNVRACCELEIGRLVNVNLSRCVSFALRNGKRSGKWLVARFARY